MRSTFASVLSCLILLSVATGCGDATIPSPPQAEDAVFSGEIDPSQGSFLIARIDEPGLIPLRIDLVGRNLQVEPSRSEVSLEVTVVNRGNTPLYPEAIVWLSDFQPAMVSVLNADHVLPIMNPNAPTGGVWGFDYSELLGDDGILTPGESSESKRWIFHDPELASFSFAAHADFQLEPTDSWITGVLFEDLNQDGIRGRDEKPFSSGEIWATLPDGRPFRAQPNSDGVYRIPAKESGLYTLRLEILVDCVTCITTPNPRQVLVVPDPHGAPQSVHGVDFGAVCAPCNSWAPLVRLVDAPPDSLEPQHGYTLLGAEVEGNRMHLRVGFSGCGPDHPFQLVAGRGFMESLPVATWLRLLHDNRNELCDAWFERDLVFNLHPIQAAHIEDYGGPGVVRLLLKTPDGLTHELRLEP